MFFVCLLARFMQRKTAYGSGRKRARQLWDPAEAGEERWSEGEALRVPGRARHHPMPVRTPQICVCIHHLSNKTLHVMFFSVPDKIIAKSILKSKYLSDVMRILIRRKSVLGSKDKVTAP